jgi:Zn-dependent M28 family amino/carboxypeptidase
MRRLAPIAGFLLVLVLPAAATSPREFSAERFKAHVTFLADDLLEGREAGTRGHEIAARYVASQFELLGIKPAGTDGTYYQRIEFSEATLTGTAPSLEIKGPAGARTFSHGDRAYIGGPVSGGSVDVTAPLVFAGYGMTDAALGIDDYKGLDVRNKIAVVLWGLPKGMDSEIGAHLQSQQAGVAGRHGAVAVIRVDALIPWAVFAEFAGEPATTWIGRDGAPFDPSGGLKAGAVMEQTAAEALFAGAATSLAQIVEAAGRGERPAGFALATEARLTATTTTRRFSSPEVIGVIEGSDPVLKNEYVAFMAHADHIGITGSGPGDHINNGALDNAAGVATLIEVGRAFATSAARPRRSILLVANTAEEKGLLGADFFAHNPTVPIDRVTAAIDLDMPLLLYDFSDVIAYGASHSTLDTAFRDAGAAMHVSLTPDPIPEQAMFVRSDHYAMVKAGVPAVMVATGRANGGKAAWDTFLSRTYHSPSDDVSQPIVWSVGAKFAELNYRAVLTLANSQQPAQWYEHDYFGDLFAPRARKAVKRSSGPARKHSTAR